MLLLCNKLNEIRKLICLATRVGGIKRWCASDVCLSDICLSRISGYKSRTERPRKTKIDTEVAHVTRDSDTSFKVKMSKVNFHGAGAYYGGLPHSLLCMHMVVNRSYPLRCDECGQYGMPVRLTELESNLINCMFMCSVHAECSAECRLVLR